MMMTMMMRRTTGITAAVLYCFSIIQVSHALSSPAPAININSNNNKQQQQQQQQPSSCSIRRVAIIGSGIAGLSLAHALENSPELMARGDGSPIEVTVYDSRPSLNYEAGAGVQLNGGMAVLNKINPVVQRAVADAALPLKQISSRTKPWFGGQPFATLLTLPIEEAIKSVGGRVENELIINGEVMAYTIMRGALQETLLNTLPKETLRRVKFGKTLTQITAGNNSNSSNDATSDDKTGILIGFDDGTSEGPFDMVVGCDGVNSAVKEYVETGTIPESGRKGNQALYSGIRIRYAVQDKDASSEEDGTTAKLSQYFGDGAYALSGNYGSGKGRQPIKCAFTIYLDEGYYGPFRKKESKRTTGLNDENNDWSQDNRKGTSERMLDQIEACSVPDIEIRPIIENASRFFELGVYLHSPFSFKGWSKEVSGSGGRFCTLGGDAAHAMPPFLGQGSNQAIQDSYCLAKKIVEYNKHLQQQQPVAAERDNDGKKNTDIAKVLKSYEQTRWGPTTSISAKASALGYLEASTGLIAKFRDVFFFTLGSLGVAKKVYLGAAVPNVGDDESESS